ncbi:hypothetical protein CFBP5473_12480 [Agrobacterium larrymoorei]|uniref:Propionyl-coenzyme A carboxylase alpha polypeptide n=1 Tax=Agrobacterium larrymoorei TaxID=160699 RepID=A0A4D7E241_9HYPH|nr:hypothetical protein CFBP5473_12480 [Agrobacterium larrymoorei]
MFVRRRTPLHPPLSCRTSPPQGGRSICRDVAARNWPLLSGRCYHVLLISPLEGEMSGRTEGGAVTC